MISEGQVAHDAASLHYLIHEGEPSLTPLVYVPGTLGDANDFRDEMIRLAPRTTVAISPRGIGGSRAPSHGYSFESRVNDLQVLLTHLHLPQMCVMAFSAGVPIALSYAISNPRKVKALILLDYPPVNKLLSDGWAEQAKSLAQKRGIAEHVILAMVEESKEVELWDEIRAIQSPTLLIKGGQSRLVSDETLERYQAAMPQLRIEIFENSGHEVYLPDYERFMQAIQQFLLKVD